jgi:serine/threonine protein kinase
LLARHDKHVDHWCLGAVVFELLTDLHLFSYDYDLVPNFPPDTDNERQVRTLRLLRRLEAGQLPEDWITAVQSRCQEKTRGLADDLIQKLLSRDPQHRLSLDQVLKHNWFKEWGH